MILVIGGAFQGKTAFAKKNLGVSENGIFNGFHLKIRACMESGGEISAVTEQAKKYKVIISDEVGCGVIPLDKFDREWRENVGRELCKLAADADEVWRVNCGVGQRIK